VHIQDLWQDRVFTWRPRACEALASALADSTFRKYNGYAKRFVTHCRDRGTTWEEASEADVEAFLDSVTSKTARPEVTIKGVMAAILALYEGSGVNAPIHHPLISRLKKGFIVLRTTRGVEHRSPIPVHKVVEWIKSLSSNARLATDVLRLKLVALSAILLIARPSDLAKLARPNLKLAPKDHVPLRMLAFKNDYRRTGWEGKMFSASDSTLDWRECCAQWLACTSSWVKGKPEALFFLSLNAPHSELSADRIANLLKDVAERAGLDPEIFTGGTFRPGTVQAFLKADIELDRIMHIGRWRSEDVWREHYARHGMKHGDADRVLCTRKDARRK
jgi:hypothetical protein